MEIIDQHHIIDGILNQHHEALGLDLLAYSGHCYRVLNYMRFLGMDEDDLDLALVALPFHDLAVWTEKSMDYLEPSFLLAKSYVEEKELDLDINHLRIIILGHHKTSKIDQSPVAELLRKADLIDLSKGMIRFGLSKAKIAEVKSAMPYYGFQSIIMRKVIVHAIKHPFKPFPMLS
ncbi:MAG: HD domain-containing protein [Bacteroidia bacterium]